MGVYATALWLIARDSQLPALAAPEEDIGALEEAVHAAQQRSVRKPVSIGSKMAALADPLALKRTVSASPQAPPTRARSNLGAKT